MTVTNIVLTGLLISYKSARRFHRTLANRHLNFSTELRCLFLTTQSQSKLLCYTVSTAHITTSLQKREHFISIFSVTFTIFLIFVVLLNAICFLTPLSDKVSHFIQKAGLDLQQFLFPSLQTAKICCR